MFIELYCICGYVLYVRTSTNTSTTREPLVLIPLLVLVLILGFRNWGVKISQALQPQLAWQNCDFEIGWWLNCRFQDNDSRLHVAVTIVLLYRYMNVLYYITILYYCIVLYYILRVLYSYGIVCVILYYI